jgi:hypothetical protein
MDIYGLVLDTSIRTSHQNPDVPPIYRWHGWLGKGRILIYGFDDGADAEEICMIFAQFMLRIIIILIYAA